jgi:hypothetical protein
VLFSDYFSGGIIRPKPGKQSEKAALGLQGDADLHRHPFHDRHACNSLSRSLQTGDH